MIDWGKYWIQNPYLISMILSNHIIEWENILSRNTGEVVEYPIKGKWSVWEFEAKSPTWLEITGSLHKYWNKGTNETDFYYYDIYQAIRNLCSFLEVSPYCISIHNLEFGVNIRPVMDATEIIRDIVCFKNKMASIPINDGKGYYTQYTAHEYFFKVYDKGKQARENWKKECGNILRIEIKARNNGFIHFANITTMADVLNVNSLELLGNKLYNFTQQLIFDDKSIQTVKIKKTDLKVYSKLANPKAWTEINGKKTGTEKEQENRFRSIVEAYGSNKHSSTISEMVLQKWTELMVCSNDEQKEVTIYLDTCNKNIGGFPTILR